MGFWIRKQVTMTDRQIIIDGVDVSKCRYFRPGSALTCSRMYGGACDNKYSNELCYFKQLARKTAECEELKSVRDSWISKCEQEIKTGEFFQNRFDDLKQSLTEIKEYCTDLKKDHYWGMRITRFADEILQKNQ